MGGCRPAALPGVPDQSPALVQRAKAAMDLELPAPLCAAAGRGAQQARQPRVAAGVLTASCSNGRRRSCRSRRVSTSTSGPSSSNTTSRSRGQNHVLLDEGPLVLVETRRDLQDLRLPFEQEAASTPAATRG